MALWKVFCAWEDSLFCWGLCWPPQEPGFSSKFWFTSARVMAWLALVHSFLPAGRSTGTLSSLAPGLGVMKAAFCGSWVSVWSDVALSLAFPTMEMSHSGLWAAPMALFKCFPPSGAVSISCCCYKFQKLNKKLIFSAVLQV